MISLIAKYEAAKKLVDDIAAALDLTTWQSQFLSTVGLVLLALALIYPLWCYFRATPEIPTEETFQPPVKPSAGRRRLYALVGLIAGVFCLIFGGYSGPMPGLGWLLITATLFWMLFNGFLDSQPERDDATTIPTKAPADPLESWAIFSLIAGFCILILSFASLSHAEKKAKNLSAAEAERSDARRRLPIVVEVPPGAGSPGGSKEKLDEDLEKIREWRRKYPARQPMEEKAAESQANMSAETKTTAQEKPSPGAK